MFCFLIKEGGLCGELKESREPCKKSQEPGPLEGVRGTYSTERSITEETGADSHTTIMPVCSSYDVTSDPPPIWEGFLHQQKLRRVCSKAWL